MKEELCEIEKSEVERQDCFLCRPNPDFVYLRGSNAFLMSGLGSLSPGYSIISPYRHVYDLSSFSSNELSTYIAFSEYARKKLCDYYGTCLLTEHGKMPVCNSEGSEHCFHPHFLLFPNAGNIVDSAKKYFTTFKEVASLRDAIKEGAKHKNYYLISPDERSYFIFPSQNELPRQFLRVLVANSINEPRLANWRQFPNLEEALVTTRILGPFINET